MKAIIARRYGPPDVLETSDIPKPMPKDDEVLIRVQATTVTAGDCRLRSANFPRGFGLVVRLALGVSRLRRPILGFELSGQIESAGKAVLRFKAGDRVFANVMGCHAEYKCMPENGALALIPENVTYNEAAALSYGGVTALTFFRRAKIKSGERVLINGASGAVGTAAVQLSRHFGAEVTGVCSTRNVELVKSLGAADVIDYTKDDFARTGETYDIILDAAGTAPFSRCNRCLKRGGRLLQIAGTLPEMLQAPWVSMTSSKRVIVGAARPSADVLQYLATLAQSGGFRPVIDRCYSFEQIVEAHRYVETGRKTGNVVILLRATDASQGAVC